MDFNPKLLAKFPAILMNWNKHQNSRKMPWKGEKDPYKIWLSEIILQQTRVDQGLKYYEKFVSSFPNIHLLAKAKDEKVFKLWEGLGYYSRCKNLIETAKVISRELNGEFPDSYDKILALKGVGQYTASAIASFAYNLPFAVVDGNVFRVLSRYFGVRIPIDSTKGKKFFSQLANELLDKKYPGIYNQALMDFGAIICKPQNPLCQTCLLNKDCIAFNDNKVNKLPVKEKKLKIKTRWFNYLVIEFENKVYIRKRENDIWKNLFEFLLIETSNENSANKVLKNAEKSDLLKKGDYKVLEISPVRSQLLSHQKITGRFIRISLKNEVSIPGFKAVSKNQLYKFAFPRFINNYLERK
jgi:A/G-specific adenine glycosylase